MKTRSAKRAAVIAAALAISLGLAGVGPARAAAPTVTDGCIPSVPEPGSSAAVDICYTLYRPAIARPGRTVPMVLHSHGWGGSRTSDPEAFGAWMPGSLY